MSYVLAANHCAIESRLALVDLVVVVRNDREVRCRDLDGTNWCSLWGNVDMIEEIGLEGLDEQLDFVVSIVLNSRSVCHLATVREVNMGRCLVTTEDNIRCWKVRGNDKSVVRCHSETRICVRKGTDIRDW